MMSMLLLMLMMLTAGVVVVMKARGSEGLLGAVVLGWNSQRGTE